MLKYLDSRADEVPTYYVVCLYLDVGPVSQIPTNNTDPILPAEKYRIKWST